MCEKIKRSPRWPEVTGNTGLSHSGHDRKNFCDMPPHIKIVKINESENNDHIWNLRSELGWDSSDNALRAGSPLTPTSDSLTLTHSDSPTSRMSGCIVCGNMGLLCKEWDDLSK